MTTTTRKPGALRSLFGEGPTIDLRCGRWQDVLADVESCDDLISDTPFSRKTQEGALSATGKRGVDEYAHWTEEEARAFVLHWAPRTRFWMVIHNDDVLGPVMRDAMKECGRYTFSLLPVLQHQPRQTQDGPAPHGHYLIVSRPRDASFTAYSGTGWGSLPGWYECGRDGSYTKGGKPVSLMRAVVGHYTNPGHLVVDPCAGGATTLLAAAEMGCTAIGAEVREEMFHVATERLSKGYTPLPHPRAGRMQGKPKQGALW